MQIEVKAPSDQAAVRVEWLLLFYLNRLEGEAERLGIHVESVQDCLATPLTHCQVTLSTRDGARFFIDETQADLALALTRALDRAARALHRRRGIPELTLSA